MTRAQSRRMHQIARGAQLIHRFLQRRVDFVPAHFIFRLQRPFVSEAHHAEASGDEMLHRRVVQFLCNGPPLFVLNGGNALS